MAEQQANINNPVTDYDPHRLNLAASTQHQDRGTFRLDEAMATDTSPPPAEHSQASSPTAYLNEQGKEKVEEPIEKPLKVESSSSSDDEDQAFNPDDRATLRRLATRTQSYYSGRRPSTAASDITEDLRREDTLALGLDNEVFDPQSPKFDLRKWVRMTLRLVDDEGIKQKRAGVVFKNLNINGSGSALNLQSTVGSMFTSLLRLGEMFRGGKQQKHILRNFDGLMKSGELLIVLGRPGSGCSTLLKSITGELHGLHVESGSTIHYNGIQQKQLLKEFSGELVYNQEVDKHLPHLTVGQTLEHAAALRLPQQRPLNSTREEAVKHITQVIMAVFGLSHTYNTKVGNDFVRGVSGGERKRVSIAEMALASAMLGAWDNSTRGLDSATALKFVKSLRLTGDLVGSAHAVAIYQASQAIYDLFDKAVVLYEGREIFFGRADQAKAYFERMGWHCPARQTTGDFLTSVTNPAERQAKQGSEDKVPRTPDDFDRYWRNSEEYKLLLQEIDVYETEYPIDNAGEVQAFRDYKQQQQAKHVRPKSPYVVSIPMQVKLNTRRAAQRIWGDKTSTFAPIISNVVMALIVGSIFYGTPAATVGFQSKGATLFFAVLLNALAAITEINGLYAQRPIVEKHKSYAFYHPATEAISGIVLDIPIKFATATAFNVILYFMAGLRRTPSQFFLFFLINYTTMFVMAAIFRTLAALTKTISQAMAFAGVMILAIVVYTGFVVPISSMVVWFGWIRWINPVFYAFEILIANEFHGRNFTCSQFVPAYPTLANDEFICAVRGAVTGERTVSGDAYIAVNYSYSYSHVWRNFGILLAFLFAFMIIYFVAVELNSSTSSTAEVLVFRRGHVPAYLQNMTKGKANDQETQAPEKAAQRTEKEEGEDVNVIPPQTDIFTWKDVKYDIPVKEGTRRLLDNVSGFVKPGTLTALMGTSGAGKTTLLDVLAQRTTMGVITGNMFVNGAPLDSSFQRKTGYVQQQDLHLETATVRESLRFSAMLRQPKSVSKQEKYDFVEDVIKMLNMEDFAEAVVGVPGEGLNVEQRKLLTIGVELAAKPKLLLFLDEPTSGLDSQSSWAICAFLRKLADSGQAVLCTIHQPSAILFQTFDRLLFLRKGGKTVYFGDIGEQSRTLLDYFETNGARKCDDSENPAEYMLEIVGDEETDWVGTWNNSNQAQGIQRELEDIHKSRSNAGSDTNEDASAHSEFAMPFGTQLYQVTYRVFQQYWRMPSYIAAKVLLTTACGLFIGFSFFNADVSLQGMQTVIYALFMVTTIFSTLVQQIMPLFVTQRELFEVRERPSKAYSWRAFLIANIVVELPYQVFASLLIFATFYYPVVGIQDSERQGLVLLLCVVFLVYASTFAHMCIAALPDAQTAGSIVTFLFSMSLLFNGVMQAPSALPGFWIFMYRVSPFTYWVASMAAAMLDGRQVTCSDSELSVFQPPQGLTCQEYLQPYLQQAPGYLQNPQATSDCGYCQIRVADTFLEGVNIQWSERWRNFGLMWVYVFFNIAMAVFVYWFFRVRTPSPKKSKSSKSKKSQQNGPVTEGAADESGSREQCQRSTAQEAEEGNQAAALNTGGVAGMAQGVGNAYLTYNLGRVQTNRQNAHVF